MGMQKMPVKKAIPMVLAALVMVGVVSALVMKLNLCMWIVWLGMCAWSAMGMKTELYEVVKCWVSGAFGTALGFILTQGVFGNTGSTIALVVLLIFIFGMVSGRFPIVCNMYTGLFLTCTTAQGISLEPLQMAESFVFGFVLFGLIPVAVSTLGKKKKAKAEQSNV